MKKAFFALIFLAIVIAFVTTLQRPNKLSKELYVEACGLLQSLKSATSYKEAFALCNKANSNIEQIVSKYSSTDMAIGLLSGQVKIADLKIDQLKEKMHFLGQLSEAEQEPLSCALALVLHKRKFEALPEIAGCYVAIGRNETAKQILDKAVESKQFNESLEEQIDIAAKYGASTYKEEAQLLLNKLRNQIVLSNQPNLDQLRTKMALVYAELGQVDFFLQMASGHKDRVLAAEAFASAVSILSPDNLSVIDIDKIIVSGMECANNLAEQNRKAFVLDSLLGFLKKCPAKKHQEILPQILGMVTTLEDRENDKYVAKCKLALMEDLVSLGLFDSALNLTTSMQNSYVQTYAFLPLLTAYNNAGKKAEIESTLSLAQKTFDVFLTDLNKIEQDFEKFELFYTFIGSFKNFLEKSRLSEHLKTLLQFAYEIEFMPSKAVALTKTGALFYLSGEKARAKEIFKQAKNLLDSDQTGEAYEENDNFARIALESSSLELFKEVLGVFESLPANHMKSSCLADLSLKLANLDQKEAAKQLLIKAINDLDEFAYEDGVPQSWGNVFEKCNDLGCNELASQKLLTALTKIYSPDDYGVPIYNLIAISQVYNRAGVPLGAQEKEILLKILHTEIPLKYIL
ncbi:hypothetical protein EOM81_09550 [bacterium]|nr:hypothetical protein [bacterium]